VNIAWNHTATADHYPHSLIPGLTIFTLRERIRCACEIALNLNRALLKMGLVGLILRASKPGLGFRFSVPFLPGGGGATGRWLSLQFITLSPSSGWPPPSTRLAIWKDSPLRSRFLCLLQPLRQVPRSAWRWLQICDLLLY